MTRTHNGHCATSGVVPWTMCTCICDGAQHPRDHSFLVPRLGSANPIDYATAFEKVESPEGRLMRQVFMLVRRTLPDPDVQRSATDRICRAIRTTYYNGKPTADSLTDDEIVTRQESSGKLVGLAKELEQGRALEPEIAAALSAVGAPSTALCYFYAVLQCGYLGDFTSDAELVELVDPGLRELLPQLLHLFVIDQAADSEAELVELLIPAASFLTFFRDMAAIIDGEKSALGSVGGLPSEAGSHLACTLLSLVAKALEVPGSVVDGAAETISQAVASMLPQSWPKPAKELALKVVVELVERVLTQAQAGGVDLSLAPMLAIIRLAAVALCPSIENHLDVQKCLEALTTQTLADRLEEDVNRDVARVLPLGTI